MSFGSRLTEARKRKGLTQEALGKGLGTDGKDASKAVVYGWEKDQHFPRVDQLAMICERLEASADQLLFGIQAPPSGLLPDVAELARAVNDLHETPRRFVIETARLAISHAHLLAQAPAEAPIPTDTRQAPSHERSRKLR